MLLLMVIFLYGKQRRLSKKQNASGRRQNYIAKSIIILVLAVGVDRLFLRFRSTNLSPDFKDGVELVSAMLMGLIWYIENKKLNIELRNQVREIRSGSNEGREKLTKKESD